MAENSLAVNLTDANFDELVLKSGKPVLVDFWAEWCGPCISTIGPIMDQMAKEYEGKAVIGKLDVSENPKVSVQFGIRNLPYLLFFKDGKVVDKQAGAAPKSVLAKKLEQYVG